MTTAPGPSRLRISLILGIGVAAVSLAAPLIRLAFQASGQSGGHASLMLAASRLTFSALLLLPAWLHFRQTAYTSRSIAYAIGAGVCLAIHFAAWITSLAYTSIAASTALVTTNPIWIALGTWYWHGDRPHLRTWLGIGLSMLGVLLIAVPEAHEPIAHHSLRSIGNLLALLAAGFASLYLLWGQAAQQNGLALRHHIAIAYTTAAIALAPLPWLLGEGSPHYPGQFYFYALLLAVFPQLIGHTSFNWAVRWISPVLTTLIILVEPLGASLLGYYFFGEVPGSLVILGAILLLIGVACAAVPAGETPR